MRLSTCSVASANAALTSGRCGRSSRAWWVGAVRALPGSAQTQGDRLDPMGAARVGGGNRLVMSRHSMRARIDAWSPGLIRRCTAYPHSRRRA
jgi:hypothetical protein